MFRFGVEYVENILGLTFSTFWTCVLRGVIRVIDSFDWISSSSWYNSRLIIHVMRELLDKTICTLGETQGWYSLRVNLRKNFQWKLIPSRMLHLAKQNDNIQDTKISHISPTSSLLLTNMSRVFLIYINYFGVEGDTSWEGVSKDRIKNHIGNLLFFCKQISK